MKLVFLLLFAFLFGMTAFSKGNSRCYKQIKIGIVDTGLNLEDPRFYNHLCRTGHKNFVPDETIGDYHGHGTFVAGLIQKWAKNHNYCFHIYKYYKETDGGKLNLEREILALRAAIANKDDIVNFSGGGETFNEEESLLIKNNPDITFVVAAGNEGKNLDLPGNAYYPASLFYDNMEVVENIGKNYELAETSNYSERITNKEIGMDVVSYLPNGAVGRMSGTSMSTAIFSGKLVAKQFETCNNR